MADFTRITVVGSVSRADLVVPDDEPFSSVLPSILDLLGEASAETRRPLALVRVTGHQVDLALDSAQQGVLDGEVLRIVRVEDAPPPPEVSDVTDVVADQLVERGDRWAASTRRATAAVFIGAAALLLGSGGAALGGSELGGTAGLIVAGAFAAAIVGAVIAGAVGAGWSTLVATAIAIGVAPPAAFAVTSGAGAEREIAAVVVAAGLIWTATGIGFGLAGRDRAALSGSVLGVVFSIGTGVMIASPLSIAVTAGILATSTLIVLGALPWFAMTVSGLTGLDDQVVDGRLPLRTDVRGSLDAAYRSLDWCTVAIAVPLAVSALILVQQDEIFAVLLGATSTLVTALRTRAFPLSLQGVVLWAAAAVPAVGLAFSPLIPDAIGFGYLAGLLVSAALLAGLSPVAHQRARLRRFGNLLETLAVIAVIPFLLGVFDLYDDLLRTF